MKRIMIALVIALVLLLLPSVVSAAIGIEVVSRIGDGVWTNDTWQVQMFPGGEKATTLRLYNSSSSSLSVEVTVFPSSFDNGNLIYGLDKSSFTMPSKSYTDVTLSARTSGSTTPGTYVTKLEIKSEVPAPLPSGGGGADITAPEISGITLCGITETTADIGWTTNEWSTSQVEYWASPTMLSPLDKTLVITHRVHLTNLTPSTTYHYKTMSKDEAGNLRVSSEQTFTTLGGKVEPTPPVPPKPTPPETPSLPPEPVLTPPEPESTPPEPEPTQEFPPESAPITPGVHLNELLIVGVAVLVAVGGISFYLVRGKKK